MSMSTHPPSRSSQENYSPLHTNDEEEAKFDYPNRRRNELPPSPSNQQQTDSQQLWHDGADPPLQRSAAAQFAVELTTGSEERSGAPVIVTTTGVTVAGASYGERLLARYRATQNNRWTHWILVGVFVIYLIVVPMFLVLTFYLSFGQMLMSLVVTLAIPMVLYQLIWRHLLILHPSLDFSARRPAGLAGIESPSRAGRRIPSESTAQNLSLNPPTLTLREKSNIFFRAISKHWSYEVYQLLLTLISCSTYLFYTYHLSYTIASDTGMANYSLDIPSADAFVQAEVFLIVSFAVDYLLRLMTVQHKLVYIFSFYALVDLLCFTGVAYVNFFKGNLAPHDAIYNYYLFQGVFRFLRMRRALQSLDAPIRNRRGIALYKLGPFEVTKKTAFFILFGLRVFLFLCSAAALVLAFEFPCISLASSPGQCSIDLQRFHLDIYFIIVTLSTVGYGDLSCATDAGRVLMSCVIIYALIQVPRELQMFAELEAEQKKQESLAVSQAVPTAASDSIPSPGSTHPSTAREDEVELARILTSPSPSASPDAVSGFHPISTVSSPSPPPPTTGISTEALQHFVAGDTNFLCRWAELQLSKHLAADPQRLQRLAAALDLTSPSGRACTPSEIANALFLRGSSA